MFVSILTAVAPILIALIGIIPTVLSNGKKTRDKVGDLQTTLDKHIKEDEDDAARNRRYRILRFYDEMCEGKLHSESHFEDIIEDIDRYETYCNKHPDFVNNRGAIAMRTIKSTYDRIKIKGGFLVHKDDDMEVKE